MALKIDYKFVYNYIIRFLFFHKFFNYNTYAMPKLKALIIYFSVNEMEAVDNPKTFNYFFLIRFFFGKRAFFTKYSNFTSFSRNFYNFNVQVFFNKCDYFFPIFFLVNDMLPFVSNKFFSYFFVPTNANIFILRFFDMNLFLEKKTNAGLYSLNNNLNFKFFFECSDYELNDHFLYFFKILW